MQDFWIKLFKFVTSVFFPLGTLISFFEIHLSRTAWVTSDDVSIIPKNGVLYGFEDKFNASSHL